MAKSSVRNKNKGSGLVKLKFVVEKLQKSLLRNNNNKSNGSNFNDACDEVCDSKCVPEDVKEGHFAVIAHDEGTGEGPKRFVMPLSCLTNPDFLRLLEQAAEEYGFDHEGALTIPCRPSEIECIQQQQCWQEEDLMKLLLS